MQGKVYNGFYPSATLRTKSVSDNFTRLWVGMEIANLKDHDLISNMVCGSNMKYAKGVVSGSLVTFFDLVPFEILDLD